MRFKIGKESKIENALWIKPIRASLTFVSGLNCVLTDVPDCHLFQRNSVGWEKYLYYVRVSRVRLDLIPMIEMNFLWSNLLTCQTIYTFHQRFVSILWVNSYTFFIRFGNLHRKLANRMGEFFGTWEITTTIYTQAEGLILLHALRFEQQWVIYTQ